MTILVNQTKRKKLLAIYDVSGIQDYVFASSKLRENVGASRIVGKVLKKLLPQILKNECADKAITEWEKATSFHMKEDDTLWAEIIYIGGGNAVVAYRDADIYNKVNRSFAKKLLEDSYSLTIATTCVETAFTNYSEDRRELMRKLAEVKENMTRRRPWGSLPITEQEGLTGLPMTRHYQIGNKEKFEDISLEQELKRDAADVKETDEIGEPLSAKAVYAREMDDLVSNKGEDGFVAVVHIDGNAIGQKITRYMEKFADYGRAVKQMRDLAKAIADAYEDVFHGMTQEIYERIAATEKNEKYSFMREKEPIMEDDKHVLPLRPLILDGDDITFLCNGRLGVPLAARFLRQIAQVEGLPISLSVCAGVALVHSHFPFNIAYKIAESCCGNAKRKRLKNNNGQMRMGYIDFHICQSGYLTDIEDLRKNEYFVTANHEGKKRLLKRPYRVATVEDSNHYFSFDCLDQILKRMVGERISFQGPSGQAKEAEGKKWPRSRLKKLYETYLLSAEKVGFFLDECASRGYQTTAFTKEELRDGFAENGTTPLYDALELLDLYEIHVFSSSAGQG